MYDDVTQARSQFGSLENYIVNQLTDKKEAAKVL
jgi:hypothetical protein